MTSSYAESDAASSFREGLFRDRCALVTGGTSGIGAAVARGLASAGASVTVTGASAGDVQSAQADAANSLLAMRVLDVRDAGAVTTVVDAIGRLDIVVNCAGVIRRAEELRPDIFDEVVDVNLGGTMRICAAARALLARSGAGCIVNTASMLSFFGAGSAPGYAASKGGVAQLTKSLAIAYAEDGIRVNAIAPGWIETRLTSALQQDPQRYAAIRDRTALKRWGQPEDLVGAVLFLCSPAANYITGIVLPVDGGYLAV